MRWLDGITDARYMNLGKLWEVVRDMEAWHAVSVGSQRVECNWVAEQQLLTPKGDNVTSLEDISPKRTMS